MRILIVEDELRIARAIKRSLEAHHFATDIVANGEEGLSHGYDKDYDVIILDRILPGKLTGLDICQKLRDSEVTTPILMLTALGEVEDRITGLSSGADDYLVKPFSMSELIMRVQVLLRRPNETVGPLIRIADLVVNAETFDTKRNSQPVKLSAREFKLLLYLIRNHDTVLSKDKIISHAWDEDADIMPNTIEVYISALRKKIDRAFPDSPALIHTIHGFGYRLGADDV